MTTKIPYDITIGWLYPRLMNTYGDRGNILILQKRCAMRNITCNIVPLDETTDHTQFQIVDAVFGGGAQDREQSIVMNDLKGKKQELLKKRIDTHMPALFVCGAPQLMGKWYEPAFGERIEGVGIFDMTTKHPGPDKPRIIGSIVAKIQWEHIHAQVQTEGTNAQYIVGFENHGGRTLLGQNVKPFANVIVGNGNNGRDNTEGVVYNNAIGTYLHGPLLSKNPHIADFFIQKILQVKYKKEIALSTLDDFLEYKAQTTVAKRLGVDL